MKEGARSMWMLRKGFLVAFAEQSTRGYALLKELRQLDARMKHGRITSVLQCKPSSIEEAIVYDERACA